MMEFIGWGHARLKDKIRKLDKSAASGTLSHKKRP